MCETTILKKKPEEYGVMIEDKKRLVANRHEENSSDVQRLSTIQLDLMNQLIISNQELNKKDIEITTLESQNKIL